MTEFYDFLATTPIGVTVEVSRPKNMLDDTQVPGFMFKDTILNRKSAHLYKCNDKAILVWDWKNGAVIYDKTGSQSLELSDYWNTRPAFPQNISKQDIVLGHTLSLIQFKGRKNYAHFILECISKLFYFQEYTQLQQFDYFLVDKFMEKAFSEIASILKLKGKPIFIDQEGDICCENLYITSHLRHPANYTDPVLLKAYHQITDSCKNVSDSGKRIFIDRRDGSRGIVNRKEVDAILDKYNFRKVNFDDIDIKKQISMVNNADIISGIHGAGFANLIFSTHNKGKSCIEIIPKSFGMQSYWLLANGLGIEYLAVPPRDGWGSEKIPATKFDDIDVNLKILEESIKMAIQHCEHNV